MSSASANTSGDLAEAGKRAAAFAAVRAHVTTGGMRLGIGSGSTVVYVVEALRALCRERDWSFTCVPTSFQSRALIAAGVDDGLVLADLISCPSLDVCIDGADEVALPALDAIKGGGGCQAQEKLVASAALELILVADARKRSTRLGTAWRKGVPLEVLPAAYVVLQRRLVSEFGAVAAPLRMALAKAGPVVTDNGNLLIDADFGAIADPAALDARLLSVPGLFETGLFCGMASVVYLGMEDGSVEVHRRPGTVPTTARST